MKKRLLFSPVYVYICILIAIILYQTLYSVLSTDDFAHAVEVGVYQIPFFSYIRYAWLFMADIYMRWQGTYFSMFLQGLLSPINQYGITQLHIVMFVQALCFFLSFVFFLKTLLQEHSKQTRVILFALFLFSLFQLRTYPEVFTWFSGATSYSMPLSVYLLGFSFLIQSRQKHTILYSILSAICFFLAGGGSLTIVGLGCYWGFLLIFGNMIETRHIDKREFLLFFIMLLGALINVCAPGNYLRHAEGATSLQIGFAFLLTYAIAKTEILFLAHSIYYFIAILASFLLGCFQPSKRKRFLLYSFLSLGTFLLVIFPLALGYNSQEVPNRVWFVIDFAIVSTSIFFLYHLGQFFSSKYIRYIVGVMLALACILGIYRFPSSIQFTYVKQIINGEVQRYYQHVQEEYQLITDSKEMDIVLPKEVEPPLGINPFIIDNDPDTWNNQFMAQYFGKNSIRRQ